MCGCENKGALTSQNVDGVHIGNGTKDVCGHCIGAVWRHVATGYYLRFCQVCKRFHHVHEFEKRDGETVNKNFDPFTTPKCADARVAARAVYHKKKQRLEK